MGFGVSHLVNAARKAVHAMRTRSAYLHLRDPHQQCNLFDIFALPILSCGSEVWATDPNVGSAAEVLHRQFLKRLVVIRDSTATDLVLAKLGRCPLQTHSWQQVLRYHNSFFKLHSVRLSKVAKLAGTNFDSKASAWRPQLTALFDTQPGRSRASPPVDAADIVERETERRRAAFLASNLSSATLLKFPSRSCLRSVLVSSQISLKQWSQPRVPMSGES